MKSLGRLLLVDKQRRRFSPRRFDFYLKWSIGNWAENIVYDFCQKVLAQELDIYGYRYGYSAGRIPKNLVEFEEIQRERLELERYGKRPNFLLFDRQFAEKHDFSTGTKGTLGS